MINDVKVFHVFAVYGKKGDSHYRVQSFHSNSFFGCLVFMLTAMRDGYFLDLQKLHFSFKPRGYFYGNEADFDRYEHSI